MNIQPAFEYGAILYIKNDVEQLPCIVTGYAERPTGLKYILDQNGEEIERYYFELDEKVNKELMATYKESE